MISGFDPVTAFNLLLERLDEIVEELKRIATALERREQ